MKRKASFLICLSLLLAAMTSWSENGEVQSIYPESVYELLASKQDIILIDVRTHDEYVAGHIPGAILFPVPDINSESAAKIIGPDITRMVIAYCASGNRSRTATSLLLDLGYMNVWNMGSLSAWPFEIEHGEPLLVP
ncbi:MAG: rhodanese-like domain-containing protein [Rectinema sp.]